MDKGNEMFFFFHSSLFFSQFFYVLSPSISIFILIKFTQLFLVPYKQCVYRLTNYNDEFVS